MKNRLLLFSTAPRSRGRTNEMTNLARSVGRGLLELTACLLWAGIVSGAPASGNENTAGARLSRQEAIRVALAHNPSIAAAREEVAQAKAQISVATAWPDPSFVTEVDQEKNFFSPGTGTETDLGIDLPVPFPSKTHLNGKIARAGWKASQYSFTLLEQQITAQTAQAYDALLVALRHRRDLTQGRDLSRQFLEKTQARFRAGTAPKLDTLKAKVDLSAAENSLIANERVVKTATAGLNRLLGRPLGTPAEPSDTLVVPPAIPPLADLVQLAGKSRLELKNVSLEQEAAHDATRLARQYWIPDLDLTLWHSRIQGAPDSYKFDAGLTLPLFFWQHKKGEVAQAEHREKELKAVGRDMTSQVFLEVRSAYAAATTARRQTVYLRNALLPEAQAEFKAAFASYSLGGSSALELIDAKRTLLDAKSQYADALGAANDARADLEQAVGTALPLPSPTQTHEP